MSEDTPKEITFRYVKGNSFRVAHADGAWGGITPHLGVFLAFWSERPPIPEKVTQEILPDKNVGPERPVYEEESGIVRELEAGVIIDEQTARSLIEWLNGKLQEIERAKQRQSAQANK